MSVYEQMALNCHVTQSHMDKREGLAYSDQIRLIYLINDKIVQTNPDQN